MRPGHAELQRQLLFYEQVLPSRIDAAKRNTAGLPALQTYALTYAALAHACHSSPRVIRSTLTLVVESGIAALLSLSSSASTLHCRIDGDPVELHVVNPPELDPPSLWERTFHCAQIIADDASLMTLRDLPLSVLGADEHAELLFAALLEVHFSGKLPRQHLRWIRSLKPDRSASSDRIETSQRLELPLLRLLERMHERDAQGFTRLLAEALEHHRLFFEARPDAWQPDAAMAWRVASLATMAERRGVMLEGQVDPHGFLPLELIRGLA